MSRPVNLLLASAFAAALFGAPAFTSLDYPGAINTFLTGTNHFSQIVGYYQRPDKTIHSFIYQNGSFASIPDFPGSTSTYVLGINNDALLTGQYITSPTTSGSFLYNLNTGVFKTLQLPSTQSSAFGVNGSGNTAGFYVSSGTTLGFINFGNDYATIFVPGSTGTAAHGISGIPGVSPTYVVGAYTTDATPVSHGFLWSNGSFFGFDYPGSVSTNANGIFSLATGASIQIVGTYHPAGAGSGIGHGFLLTGLATYSAIDYPGAGISATNPASINDIGVIVGSYQGADFNGFTGTHGFIRTP